MLLIPPWIFQVLKVDENFYAQMGCIDLFVEEQHVLCTTRKWWESYKRKKIPYSQSIRKLGESKDIANNSSQARTLCEVTRYFSPDSEGMFLPILSFPQAHWVGGTETKQFL